MGLYGNKIKPGSFYLSSSGYHIIDDCGECNPPDNSCYNTYTGEFSDNFLSDQGSQYTISEYGCINISWESLGWHYNSNYDDDHYGCLVPAPCCCYGEGCENNSCPNN